MFIGACQSAGYPLSDINIIMIQITPVTITYGFYLYAHTCCECEFESKAGLGCEECIHHNEMLKQRTKPFVCWKNKPYKLRKNGVDYFKHYGYEAEMKGESVK